MSDKTMPITGGCMCGAIRYEATEHPQETGYCHCSMCQAASGNAFIAYAMFRSTDFRFTHGKPKLYRSSAWMDRGFCTDCGTPVINRYLKGNDIVVTMLCSLDHPEEWPPAMHVGVESQMPWLAIHDDLPRTRTEDDDDYAAVQAATEKGVD